MKRLVADSISTCWFTICCWTGDGSKTGSAAAAPGRELGDAHPASATRAATVRSSFEGHSLMATRSSGMPVLSRSVPRCAGTYSRTKLAKMLQAGWTIERFILHCGPYANDDSAARDKRYSDNCMDLILAIPVARPVPALSLSNATDWG